MRESSLSRPLHRRMHVPTHAYSSRCSSLLTPRLADGTDAERARMAAIRRRRLLTELPDELGGIHGDMPLTCQEGVYRSVHFPATGTPTVVKTNQQHRSSHSTTLLSFFLHPFTAPPALSASPPADGA